MRYVSAVPAYGRDYQTEQQVREAWEAGKDFLIQDPIIRSCYISKNEKPEDMVMQIRYAQKREVCVIGQPDDEAMPEE